jgi:hypothetical protein
MSEKHKCASPSAIQVKCRRKTIGIEEKLGVISDVKKANKLFIYTAMFCLAHGIVLKIRDNVDRIKEGAKSRTKCLCSTNTTVLPNEPY